MERAGKLIRLMLDKGDIYAALELGAMNNKDVINLLIIMLRDQPFSRKLNLQEMQNLLKTAAIAFVEMGEKVVDPLFRSLVDGSSILMQATSLVVLDSLVTGPKKDKLINHSINLLLKTTKESEIGIVPIAAIGVLKNALKERKGNRDLIDALFAALKHPWPYVRDLAIAALEEGTGKKFLSIGTNSREWKITISAGSLSKAREKIKKQIPTGSTDLLEFIIDDGSVLKRQQGSGKTIEVATLNAKNNIPNEAKIIEKRILSECTSASLSLQSFNEQDARLAAKMKLPINVIIDKVACVDEGEKGFLGFRKKPATYEFAYTIPAKVEMVYQIASISVSFMEPK